MSVTAEPKRARKPPLPRGKPRQHLPLRSRTPITSRPRRLAPYVANTPCWIITLQPRSNSVDHLVSAAKMQRLHVSTIIGVDGRAGRPHLVDGEFIDNETSRWRHLCELKNSEIGCYLAHLRAIRRAYRSGLDRVCILEDDVQLEPSFGRVLAELERLPEDIEMIRLMGLKVRKRKIIQPLNDGVHRLVRPERGWCGAQGYLINRAGMEKVLNYANRIFEPIDKVFDHFWQFDLKLYGIEPHLLWESEHTSSIIKSNIHRANVPRWLYWLHPFGKLWRSVERHLYLKRHAREFYPAQKPIYSIGRTARIKR
ncbi:glycosyltransferase family 25 protein [Microbulbifer sp. OS29]|uniref:Glycosyltransferase family 25 protein n=1 Tax=Microbulbifer okhotskensis TaxID=2926617 RepID=A0A9X2EQ93_9GAMM|nr:glycosyltransferase family 25 protein [Microbulbifer okhotskensis]MCO1333743.1 glycosyltransferase family 25 protein [Microbulbifer okhotskensis]